MKTKITLDQARFRSGNEELALEAFGKEALAGSFRDITTFKKACESLCLLQGAMDCDVDLWHLESTVHNGHLLHRIEATDTMCFGNFIIKPVVGLRPG